VPLKFLLVGMANTAFGLLLICTCKWVFAFGDAVEDLTGYRGGLALSFLLNRSRTFRHTGAVMPALKLLILVFAVVYMVNLVCVLAFIHILDVNAWFSQALGVVPYAVVFCMGSRYVAFRPARAPNG